MANSVNPGFTITPRLSHRVLPVMLTDLEFAEDIACDFADDIVGISDGLVQTQELQSRVETECVKVGLHLNPKKTEYLTFNLADEPLKTVSDVALKKVEDFK